MKGRHNQGQDTFNNCPIDNILSVWGGDQIEWKEESQDVCMLYWGSAHCQLQWREQVQREELDDISSTGFSTASHPTLHSLSCQLSNDRSLVLGRGRRAKGFWWRCFPTSWPTKARGRPVNESINGEPPTSLPVKVRNCLFSSFCLFLQ